MVLLRPGWYWLLRACSSSSSSRECLPACSALRIRDSATIRLFIFFSFRKIPRCLRERIYASVSLTVSRCSRTKMQYEHFRGGRPALLVVYGRGLCAATTGGVPHGVCLFSEHSNCAKRFRAWLRCAVPEPHRLARNKASLHEPGRPGPTGVRACVLAAVSQRCATAASKQ